MSKAFWVVEAPWQPPHYIKARKMGTSWDFAWTEKIDEAMQFVREQDADNLLCIMLWADHDGFRQQVTGPGPAPRAVEHSYIQP